MANAQDDPQVAVPKYLGSDFREAAPGHRFYLYLSLWSKQWQKLKGGATGDLVSLGDDDRRRMKALAQRQRAIAEEAALDRCSPVFSLPATAIAPFTTGLGTEHPLENGFAFLSPYGLPYLPGSSVKGVLREAARELGAGGDFEISDRSWGAAEIDALFGIAGGNDKGYTAPTGRRGALRFWDVFPVLPEGVGLQWEIITPHHGHYLGDSSGQTPPHDNAAPTPIHFLTLPVGSAFQFTVQCDQTLLQEAYPDLLDGERWKTLLEEIFIHAFDWVGFGAKTRVGYGSMEVDEKSRDREEERRRQREERAREQAERASMPVGERRAAELLDHKPNPNEPEYKYLLKQLDAEDVPAADRAGVAKAALQWLEKRRTEIPGLRDRRKREKRLAELADHEERLKAYVKGGDPE